MARKSRDATESPTPRKSGFDLMAELTDAAEKQFDQGTVCSDFDEYRKSVKGVPIPNNLALQYVLGTDIIPMGRCVGVVGPYGASKTSFCWYLAACIVAHGGLVQFLDTEHKPNPEQAAAIMNAYLDMEAVKASGRKWFLGMRIRNLDELGNALMFYATKIQEAFVKCPELPPVHIIIDSLAAVTSEEAAVKRLGEDDVAGFQDARNAHKVQSDLQVYVPYTSHLPMVTTVINHQKNKVQQGGPPRSSYLPPERTEKGGEHQRFAYSWLLELRKGPVAQTVGEGIVPTFELHAKKNALGREIPKWVQVPYRTLYTGGGDGEERIWYDWNAATAWLFGAKDVLVSSKPIKDIIDVRIDRKRYSSTRLGVKDLVASDFGHAIHSDAKLMEELQDALQIRRRTKYGKVVFPFRARPADVSGGEAEPELEQGHESPSEE